PKLQSSTNPRIFFLSTILISMKTYPYIYLYSYVLLFSFLLSLILVPVVKKISLVFGILDHPGERKVHVTSKPLMGGLAIYIALMVVICGNIGAFFLFKDQPLLLKTFPSLINQIPKLVEVLPELGVVLAGGSLVMLVGMIDDIRGVGFSFKLKFIGQILAAIILVLGGVNIEFMSNPYFNIPLTILWVVGITNSFNLLDNMDGLSSGVAIIASLIFFIVAVTQGQFFTALILLTLLGSILGFLVYNFPPSSIFMGDTGSLFIGFMLGSLTVSSSYVVSESTSLLPVIMPVIILSVPIFDTLSVIYIRWREGRPIYRGDKSHFSHRLVDLGMTKKEAVLFIYLVTFCVGLVAILLPDLNRVRSLVVFVQAVIIFILIVILMIVGKKDAARRGQK
ncbi:MAG: MraY family glycosyltransferase, partial [bacterium]|nr:MraY family glycosyltransferase [bacterium]